VTGPFVMPALIALVLLALAAGWAAGRAALRARARAALAAAEAARTACEQRLRTVVDDSRDMIVTTDGQGSITFINQAGLELLRMPAASARGRAASGLWLNPPDYETFRAQLAEQGYVKDFEAVLLRADGEQVIGLLNAAVLRGKDGQAREVYAAFKDITSRIHDLQALWRANVELSDANRKLSTSQMMVVQQEKLATIGELAAGIVHEINNPLAFVKSNFVTLRRYLATLTRLAQASADPGSPGLAEARAQLASEDVLGDLDPLLSECEEGFRRIQTIVQSLSAFSHRDAGATLTAFDINGGIRATLGLAVHELKYSADVELALGELPPVECIGTELNQVFMNLVVNASHAIRGQGRPGKGRIRIRTGSGDSRVWVEVEDDGPGVAAEIRARIFEPFFTTKPAGKGTGLGLSISSEIMRHHGGTLTLVPPPPGGAATGACFRLEIPVHPPVSVPPAEPSPPGPDDAARYARMEADAKRQA